MSLRALRIADEIEICVERRDAFGEVAELVARQRSVICDAGARSKRRPVGKAKAVIVERTPRRLGWVDSRTLWRLRWRRSGGARRVWSASQKGQVDQWIRDRAGRRRFPSGPALQSAGVNSIEHCPRALEVGILAIDVGRRGGEAELERNGLWKSRKIVTAGGGTRSIASIRRGADIEDGVSRLDHLRPERLGLGVEVHIDGAAFGSNRLESEGVLCRLDRRPRLRCGFETKARR